MRIFFLPLSSRRALLHCQRLNQAAAAGAGRQAEQQQQQQQQLSLVDRLTARAATKWVQWENGQRRWQQLVVKYGNKALRRISYEEWGLKSIPPLSSSRRRVDAAAQGKDARVDVAFPATVVQPQSVLSSLRRLTTQRQSFHKARFWWCVVGMPITAPIALIPILPNLPFLYLLYRAWSHWRAFSGSKHLEFLLANQLITPSPSATLDKLYSARLRRLPTRSDEVDKQDGDDRGHSAAAAAAEQMEDGEALAAHLEGPDKAEVVLLQSTDGKDFAEALGVPELAVEVERAAEQVHEAVRLSKSKNTPT